MANSKATKAVKKVLNPHDDKVNLKMTPPSEDKEGMGEYLSCNEYNAKAKYGDTIKVPRFIAAILENSKMAKNDVKKNLAKATKK